MKQTNFRKTLKLLPGLLLFPIVFIGGIGGYIASQMMSDQPNVPLSEDTREGRWQQDIDTLVVYLTERHIDPFYVVNEAEWRAQAAELRANVGTLTDKEITFGIMQLGSMIYDGHTGIIPHEDFGGMVRRYPIDVAHFDDGLFVTRVAHEAQTALGAQIIAVNGMPVDEISQRVEPILSYDYENPYGRLNILEFVFIRPILLYMAGIVTDTAQATFTFLGAEGELFDIELTAYDDFDRADFVDPAFPQVPLYWRYETQREGAWFTHLPEHRAIYLQYNDSEMNFFDFMRISTQALQTARREGADKFIVDLRYNPGGSELAFLLFSYRLGQPSAMQVYGIMSRYTFSAGFDAITALSRRNNATIVGQPAGTRPNFFGNVSIRQLPNSGYSVYYPTTHSRKFPELGDARIFEPDISVAFTSDDFFAARDPYLEAILNQ